MKPKSYQKGIALILNLSAIASFVVGCFLCIVSLDKKEFLTALIYLVSGFSYGILMLVVRAVIVLLEEISGKLDTDKDEE